MLERIGGIALCAADGRGLVGILKKLGIYQDVSAGMLGRLRGAVAAMRDLGGAFDEGQARVARSGIRRLYEAARLTGGRRI